MGARADVVDNGQNAIEILDEGRWTHDFASCESFVCAGCEKSGSPRSPTRPPLAATLPRKRGRDWNPFVKSSSACPTDNPNNQNLCAALNQFDTHLRAGRATCAVLPRRLWVVGGISIVPEHFQDDGSSDQRLELGLQGIGFILLVNLIAVDME